jgi:hypothetical protein
MSRVFQFHEGECDCGRMSVFSELSELSECVRLRVVVNRESRVMVVDLVRLKESDKVRDFCSVAMTIYVPISVSSGV